MCVPGTVESVRARVEEEGPPALRAPRLSRRAALMAGAGTLLAGALPAAAHARRGDPAGTRIADLTHVYSDTFPRFPGTPAVARETFVTVENDGFYGQIWTVWEHSGTHIDVPGHFVSGGRLTPDLAVHELVAPIAVIDIAARAADDPDTVVTPADLVAFERRHGRIHRGSVVAMHSGWEERAGSTETYRNTDANGVMHFPGFSGDAVAWLVQRRAIRGIGVDTLSLDPGNSATFDAHFATLGSDRYGIENLRGLAQIPPRGATLYLGVIPWLEGSGGPARVLAAW